jgi:hypothetical protein
MRWTAILLGSLQAACSTPLATPEPTIGPCAQLQPECARCDAPGPKETCTTAVASGDDVQCTVALDDPGVVASCSAPDAGAEGGEAAAPPPPCGAQATADAGCSCAAPGPCSPSCEAGDCYVQCLSGATCQASCAGGGCTFDCKAGSTCANSCAGGECTFQCELDAVCSDTCNADAGDPCIGP